MYATFAYIYDELMAEVSYDSWVNWTKTKLKEDFENPSVLDVGCGTGEFLIEFNKQGFNAAGVDLSEDMLAVCKEKAESERINVKLFQQDMRDLSGLGTFDVITLYCDSLNYLSTPEDVRQTFQRLYDSLNENGMLLFDVHSTYKMEELLPGHSFADPAYDLALMWNVYEGQEKWSVEHELTFFEQMEDGVYRREEEVHKQRTFAVDKYEEWLIEANFKKVEVEADFEDSPPQKKSERILFSARK
ncbi:class I SAM-dependent DNA methyltransferase [Salsuginibacillus kocurii]|uniref:class I SAM-dependent DNA methyltransferase n=1 Tax=Salsuginibacillus kocurii TaxID=427078 RepID=UPI0003604F1D|nr:class I SAM-dependent methyltransferase [Salsuginibacillus kocurii]